MAKDAAFFRYLAERCREYIARSTSPIVKEQFELWLVEFEAQADMAAETEEAEARFEDAHPTELPARRLT